MAEQFEAEIRIHAGRPSIFINGRPTALPMYSPISWRGDFLQRSGPRFFEHRMGAYWLGLPQSKHPTAWGDSPFWSGDTITSDPAEEFAVDIDAQANFILENDPDAFLLIRNGPCGPPSWRRLHEDQLVVDEEGEPHDIPSLASSDWWESCGRAAKAIVEWTEERPWGNRVIGYWYGLQGEGTHEPLFGHKLFDHSPLMLNCWRDWLRRRYQTERALAEAHGQPGLTFDSIEVPRDKLRRTVPEVSAELFWQAGTNNAALRDYLLLQGELFHAGVRKIFRTQVGGTQHKRIFVADWFKQSMPGWSNFGYFHPDVHWPLVYPEILAGSGSIDVAQLTDEPGFDAVITPADYQVRGVGGVCEPEGTADSLLLRKKYFFCEFDMRTYNDDREETAHGVSRNLQEWEAVNWRNVATALTRGFNGYWMDLVGNWYGSDEIHRSIGRAVDVMKESVNWVHHTVPGIAMILDDKSVLDTNGAGNYHNEAVMWEQKYGISRAGVPYRIYLLEDLSLEEFPAHKIFYFPNLFRVTPERLQLLQEKVFRNGNVVVWGPGSGISDGQTISPENASRLTGFEFDMLNLNMPRRTHIQDFSHPVTEGLAEDVIFGSTLSFGPVLYPVDGRSLGLCWAKQGKAYSGLSVKTFGNGASAGEGAVRGPGDWAGIFTTSVPIPASLWRNMARYSGTHIYSESNDVLLADSSVVALHSVKSGQKEIRLPKDYAVEDVISGRCLSGRTNAIHFHLAAPETRVFRLTEPEHGES